VSTSIATILDRLRRDGREKLLAAVLDGRISAYSAACECGYATRKPIGPTGNSNQRKRNSFALLRVLDGELMTKRTPTTRAQPRRAAAEDLPLPCLSCPHGEAALIEALEDYVRCRRGGLPPAKTKDGSVLPFRCCRRKAGPFDPAMLVA